MEISFGAKWGECEVRWGATRVFAVVSAEVVEPYPDRPTEGLLAFNVELCPTSDPEYHFMRNPETSIELGRMLERFLKESRAVDREALCIVAHHQVWSVRCDVHILDHCGNITDAANVCALLALMHFRRPDTTIDGNVVRLFSEDEREPVGLSVHYLPISISFVFFNNGETAVVDPIEKEELASEGRLTVTLNSFQDVCAMQKNGGVPVDAEIILQCIQRAIPLVQQITSIIEKELATDVSQRLAGRGCVSRPPPKNAPAQSSKTQSLPAVRWGDTGHVTPSRTQQTPTPIPMPEATTAPPSSSQSSNQKLSFRRPQKASTNIPDSSISMDIDQASAPAVTTTTATKSKVPSSSTENGNSASASVAATTTITTSTISAQQANWQATTPSSVGVPDLSVAVKGKNGKRKSKP
eukprot:c12595_g1_i2.p1 GENE.c12595_g1_i2~~c12595_g1_i2.p1  ORF type:complete len:459 (-),score=130.56 c12595_g1_i2:141-1373(-)